MQINNTRSRVLDYHKIYINEVLPIFNEFECVRLDILKEFNEEEISIAKSLGANIAKRYSKTVKDSYVANVCGHCNAFVGDFYMHEYYNLLHDNEINLSFKCFNCLHKEQVEKRIAEMEAPKRMEDKLFELKVREKGKQCPICGGLLLVRTGPRGPFWGCANYPSCKHTENIVLE